jgi:hypothetical protein
MSVSESGTARIQRQSAEIGSFTPGSFVTSSTAEIAAARVWSPLMQKDASVHRYTRTRYPTKMAGWMRSLQRPPHKICYYAVSVLTTIHLLHNCEPISTGTRHPIAAACICDRPRPYERDFMGFSGVANDFVVVLVLKP